MRTVLACCIVHTVACVVMIPSPSISQDEIVFEGYDYHWSLSGSSQHPEDNYDPPFQGESQVYLWLECAYFDGFTRLEFAIQGTLDVLDFTPLAAIESSGTLPTVELSTTECIFDQYLVVGVFTVSDASGNGGSLCFGGSNATQDCQDPNQLWSHGYTGYSTAGPPCRMDYCAVDYVLPRSWGRMKATYRTRD